MHEQLQAQAALILQDLLDNIIDFMGRGQRQEARLFLDQLAKFAPNHKERFSLEALWASGGGDWGQAESLLKEGLEHHPLDFDLLYNLGYVYRQKEEILQAYHLYMKARYVAQGREKEEAVAQALTELVPFVQGQTREVEDETISIIEAGGLRVELISKWQHLLERKEVLQALEVSLVQSPTRVLEIGFADGIISKNLNYWGCEVTAVSAQNERLLNVITLEWHDNLLQPRQRVAKYYAESSDLSWLKQIPAFDVILAVSPGNIENFEAQPQERRAILNQLLEKAQRQLYLLVASEALPQEFSKAELEEAAGSQGWSVESLLTLTGSRDPLELCLVNKKADYRRLQIPQGVEAEFSPSSLLEVELVKCVDNYGAAYVDDFQHFVAAMEEVAQKPDLLYQESVLKYYYQEFRPANMEEALFNRRGPASGLRKGFIALPWFFDEGRRAVFSADRGETRPGGNHNFGPNSDNFGAAELERLRALYLGFQKRGYQPELFADGYISGYLLVKDGDYRFVISEGQHRVACLAALGYKKIRVRFTHKEGYPRVVAWRRLKFWPQVANGVYSQNLARRVFMRFFAHGVGRERYGSY